MELNVSHKHTLNPRHVHYWVCGEADNGVVRALCRYCGEIRVWETQVSKVWKKST